MEEMLFHGKKIELMFGMLKSIFRLDLKIILLTIYNVLKRKDIVPKNKNSMDEFMGTDFNE